MAQKDFGSYFRCSIHVRRVALGEERRQSMFVMSGGLATTATEQVGDDELGTKILTKFRK